MSTPIVTSKLYIPPPRPNAILRPRLIMQLNEGLHRKLTLISAPAGFGKTSLASTWIAGTGRPAAWLSLDAADSDPARFLAHLVAAVQTLAPSIGAAVMASLQAAQPAPIEALLPLLLNDLAMLPQPAILVLDDYHVLDARPIDQALAMLIEHLPPQLHLVITSREDPPLPLARLRARSQLTELRAADLRFLPAEAGAFLNEVMGLSLSEHDVAALEERTEGWIAGLQLAALSLQGRHDAAAFIRAFAGNHRYILDYLVEEVLQRQPEQTRTFLLQTAILDRLNASLCDAVLGIRNAHQTADPRPLAPESYSQHMLEQLERGNFFVVPLDDTREWYRYHHLFADVLMTQLRAEQPAQVERLHRRASVWYEQHELRAEAIRHALAGQDFAHAANLVELEWSPLRRSRQEARLLSWMQALPDEALRVRPVLSAAYAHVLLATGHLEGVEDRLRDAERWLDTAAEGMVVVDHEELRRLPGTIALARAGQAFARGDVPATVVYARRVLDLAPEDDQLTRGGAAGFLGLAAWANGELETAYQTFAGGMASLQQAGNIADAINGANILAAIRIGQGRLRDAMRTYEQGLQLGAGQGAPVVRGSADMHVGMSELCCERNDLPAATQHLLRSRELGEHAAFTQNRYRSRVALARIRQIQGDLLGALDLLDEAARLYMSDFSPNVRPIAALKARVWLAQGRLEEALEWVRAQRLSAHDELSYLREFEHITLVRVLLAQYVIQGAEAALVDAIGLLERLLHAAQAGARMGSQIEILVLQALAHHLQGDLATAHMPLSRALALGEPEGYVRLFVDEGPPMAHLLREVAAHGILPGYVGKLLAAFGQGPVVREQESPQPGLAPGSQPLTPLVEPLSQRELQVLRLFKTELDGPQIAGELVISLNTLRTHTKNIYTKLGVSNRRAAVRRAEELALL